MRRFLLLLALALVFVAAVSADDLAPDGRTLAWVKFGDKCTNSYFKSAPGWKPKKNTKYMKCCDKKKKYICATYNDKKPSASFAACMTLKACKESNGGKTYKFPGWDCRPGHGVNSNSFPECHNYYATP